MHIEYLLTVGAKLLFANNIINKFTIPFDMKKK